VAELFEKVSVERVLRDGKILTKDDDLNILAGDSLLLAGSARDIKKVEWGSASPLLPTSISKITEEELKQQNMAELVVMPGTSLVGRTLSQIRFQNRYGIAVIGIQQHRHIRVRNLAKIKLRAGDVLLVQGTSGQLNILADRRDMILLWGVKDTVEHSAKAGTSALILLSVVLLAATRTVDMLVISLLGAFLMLASRCLTMRQAYAAISPQIIFMVAATLALGKAMEITGAVEFLANGLIEIAVGLSTHWILALFIFIVMLFTNIISNNASAILFAPIAIGVANQLGVSPMPFLIGVVFGANAAFATPIGYQTNLMVLSAGYYSVRDFVRVGLPLNIIVWILVSYLIPYFWGF
jgi:di/tricarboxylate transporter